MRLRGTLRGFPAVTLILVANLLAAPASRMEFWDSQRKGANFFNRVPAKERFEAAGKLGLHFIRLAPDKWSAEGRDVLMGSADHFESLSQRDLDLLKRTLDDAHRAGLPVIVAMLSLPGARWRQLNDGADDARLWESPDFLAQACRFWRELAFGLRDHPAVVAYNPLNEPHPERAAGIGGADDPGFAAWLEERRGTTADLARFYREIVAAIREVDPRTPILVEGYGHGSVAGLSFLEPVDDPFILYSFHFYEPWEYTTWRVNRGRYAYPQSMPAGWEGPLEAWSTEDLDRRLRPVDDWALRHGIPPHRIVAAEFGCDRRSPGAERYLEDVVSLLNRRGYHWAFYSYREDVWDGMDYELGDGEVRLGEAYREALERGEYRPKPWRPNSLFRVLEREFR